MNPSIETRIDSMLRALVEVVLPDLPPGSAAAEQTALVIGHLDVLKNQVDFGAAFDAYELSCMENLSSALLSAFDDHGAQASAAAANLAEKLADAAPRLPREVRERTHELGALIEEVVRRSAADGSSDFRASVSDLIIKHERPRVSANRAIFRGMNWESDVTGLPELELMLFDR